MWKPRASLAAYKFSSPAGGGEGKAEEQAQGLIISRAECQRRLKSQPTMSLQHQGQARLWKEWDLEVTPQSTEHALLEDDAEDPPLELPPSCPGHPSNS